MKSEMAGNLKTNALGLRFVTPSTEADYRDWRIGATMFFVRVGLVASLLNWSVYLLTFARVSARSFDAVWPPIAYMVMPFILLVLASTFIQRPRRLIMPCVAIAHIMSGLVTAWQVHEVLDFENTIDLVVAANVLLMFFGFVILGMPPGVATSSVLPYFSLIQYLLFGDYLEKSLSQLSFIAYEAIQWMVFMNGILVAVVLEIVTRKAFCNHRLIQAQQHKLERNQEQIRRYIPAAVAKQIIEGNEAAISQPNRHRVTVLFSDIAGFTGIADRVEPEVMTQVLSEYMSCMADLIEKHGGTLNEFAGDGLMALFGAPEVMSPDAQARSAVSAADAMQSAMPDLNNRWRKLGLGAELKIRVGINTGMVSVGSYGSQGRVTYTAIGLQTNIASRIESQVEPGETLISDATYQLISDSVPCEPRGEVECKGVHFPVKVYAPSPLPKRPVGDFAAQHI